MEHTETIVIGAGAAGLMAAYTLSKAGKPVIILEARNRTGGRIHTLNHNSFFNEAELGAEFIHGDLPVTLELLKEAGLSAEPADGEMWRVEDGKFSKESITEGNWDLLMEKLNSLQEDMPLSSFLDRYFSGDEYRQLRASVLRYLAGYDTGHPAKASSFALRNEWQHEDDGSQHRIKEGYCAMIHYLAEQCRLAGVRIYLNDPVSKIIWKAGEAQVFTALDEQYSSSRVVVALPLGILQQPDAAPGFMHFEPSIPEQAAAFSQLGFGDVIKVLLRFTETFWEDSQAQQQAGASLKNMAFLFSNEVIPTWWTQVPRHVPLLTGWLAGPPAAEVKHLTDEELLSTALLSLSHIFNRDVEELKHNLVAWHVANWSADPYTLGSYAYDTVAAPAARQLLGKGISDTLFFAGEYLYEGTAMGTVEAALTSGQQIAQDILGKL